QRPAALVMAHVDQFDKLAKGFGQPAAEAALKHVGFVLARTLREGDLAARSGDEEFALWLAGASANVAHNVSQRMRKALADDVLRWAGTELRLTCSYGVAAYPVPVDDLAELRTVASAAARRARDAGGDRVEFGIPQGAPG